MRYFSLTVNVPTYGVFGWVVTFEKLLCDVTSGKVALAKLLWNG
jgi:hypothetical protein